MSLTSCATTFAHLCVPISTARLTIAVPDCQLTLIASSVASRRELHSIRLLSIDYSFLVGRRASVRGGVGRNLGMSRVGDWSRVLPGIKLGGFINRAVPMIFLLVHDYLYITPS